MINFGFSISNPWANAVFDNIWTMTKPISENKFIEIEVLKFNTIVDFGFTVTHRTSHAGLTVEFGMFNRTVSFNLLDIRHWDHAHGKWEVPRESV